MYLYGRRRRRSLGSAVLAENMFIISYRDKYYISKFLLYILTLLFVIVIIIDVVVIVAVSDYAEDVIAVV